MHKLTDISSEKQYWTCPVWDKFDPLVDQNLTALPQIKDMWGQFEVTHGLWMQTCPFGPKVGQIGEKYEKLGLFSDQIFVHFGSSSNWLLLFLIIASLNHYVSTSGIGVLDEIKNHDCLLGEFWKRYLVFAELTLLK